MTSCDYPAQQSDQRNTNLPEGTKENCCAGRVLTQPTHTVVAAARRPALPSAGAVAWLGAPLVLPDLLASAAASLAGLFRSTSSAAPSSATEPPVSTKAVYMNHPGTTVPMPRTAPH